MVCTRLINEMEVIMYANIIKRKDLIFCLFALNRLDRRKQTLYKVITYLNILWDLITSQKERQEYLLLGR